jgi:hypothetical protein
MRDALGDVAESAWADDAPELSGVPDRGDDA